jgi:DNA-binding response OmpR family regulator
MKRIVLVEDDSILLMVVTRYLEKMGHDCIATASSCAEALEIVKEEVPDLVLMDINLVGALSGIDAAQGIRKFSDVPIFFLTGNSDNHFKQQMMEIPNSDFLIKPVGFEELQLKIEGLANR